MALAGQRSGEEFDEVVSFPEWRTVLMGEALEAGQADGVMIKQWTVHPTGGCFLAPDFGRAER